MSSSFFYAVVVPIVATVAMLWGIEALRLLPGAKTFRRQPEALRPLRTPILFIVAAYFAILIIGPRDTWHWLLSPIAILHRDLALAISGISITAWTGCLIAFAVRARLTPELSRGLRFLIYACFAPLVALTGSGFAFRGFAVAVAVVAAFWTRIQLHRWKRKTKLDLSVKPWVDENQPPPGEEALRRAFYIQRFFRDRAAEILFGWQWSFILCALAIGVLIGSSESVVFGCSLVALLGGILLSFAALVLPEPDDSGIII